MLKSKVTIAMMIIVCLSAVATATAGAHVFKSTAKGTIKGKQTNPQLFETGSTTIECSTATSGGKVESLEMGTQIIEVTYGGCKAFGQNAVVNVVKFNFNAEGTVSLGNEVSIKVPGFGCEIKLPVQGPLKTVTYVNSSGKLEVKSAAEAIKSTGTGLCGAGGSAGKYKGNELVEVEGGKLEWV